MIPYVTGILFLFLYIAGANIETFNSIDDASSFIWAWAIGYEIVAAITLFLIFKSALAYSSTAFHGGHVKRFKRP